MPKNISKELEKEILGLSQKEKDRHLLRLISRNNLLREQLQYTLLEDESDLKYRVEEIREELKSILCKRYSHVVFLTKAIRKQSTAIVWHRRVTKDKYGELLLFTEYMELILEHQQEHINANTRKADVLRVYLTKKTLAIIKMLDGLHADYRIDFLSRINKVLELLYTFYTRFEAAKLKLPTSLDI